MNRYVFKKGEGKLNPGEWRLPTVVELAQHPDVKLIHRCPVCKLIRATFTHTIAANGDMNPSVVCNGRMFVHDNYDEDRCEFHEWATNEGWGEK